MSFEDVMGTIQQMMVAVDTLAAVGAELSLSTSGTEPDPRIDAALAAVSTAAGLDLDSLAPPQRAMVLGLIRLYFAQADDLLREPARGPGWTFTDPLVLDGMGRGSMMIPQLLAAAPDFGPVTSFLDVGTGVGLLAVSAAAVWPDTRVVGIDVWEPALERARANVGAAGLDERITIRNQDATTLDDVDAYDCAWVPTFFVGEDAMAATVANVARAVRPGGSIALGLFRPAPDPLVQATMAFRTIRSGGTNLDAKRAATLLEDAGCTDVRTVEPAGPAPATFVIGRNPA